jgi:hypothetical protein
MLPAACGIWTRFTLSPTSRLNGRRLSVPSEALVGANTPRSLPTSNALARDDTGKRGIEHEEWRENLHTYRESVHK